MRMTRRGLFALLPGAALARHLGYRRRTRIARHTKQPAKLAARWVMIEETPEWAIYRAVYDSPEPRVLPLLPGDGFPIEVRFDRTPA